MPEEVMTAEAAGGIGNLALYQMCAGSLDHADANKVSDKITVIGRVYAASPARGMAASDEADFVLALAAHLVAYRHQIDEPLQYLREQSFPACFADAVALHEFFEGLVVGFSAEWQERNERSRKVRSRPSFASKYLHFHAPDAFPILDRFSELGVFRIGPKTRRHGKGRYEHFCTAISALMQKQEFKGRSLRSIDTELLKYGRLAARTASGRKNKQER